MPHNDSTVFYIKKLKYKSIYMSSYVQPNIIIKELYQLSKTPLYVNANVLVRHNWKMLINLANVCQNGKVEIDLFDEALNTLNVNNFEEIIDENHVDILVQNILIVEHVVDDNDKYVTIAQGEGF
jgi:hypothetical protein